MNNKNKKCNTYELISPKLSAVNNKVRFSILQIISEIAENNQQTDIIIKEPLYSRELNAILSEKYDINITPQMLGQHLKQLEKAELIEEVIIKKEVPNKIGLRPVKAYKLKSDAFKDLFLDINILTKELLMLFNLYESHQKVNDGKHCILTILNGVDKGNTFKLSKKDTIRIGRKNNYSDKSSYNKIVLDNQYTTVSSISNPHIEIFYQNNQWNVLDKNSTNGTFINNVLVPKDKLLKLKNKSFLRLSKGNDSVVFFCTIKK